MSLIGNKIKLEGNSPVIQLLNMLLISAVCLNLEWEIWSLVYLCIFVLRYLDDNMIILEGCTVSNSCDKRINKKKHIDPHSVSVLNIDNCL